MQPRTIKGMAEASAWWHYGDVWRQYLTHGLLALKLIGMILVNLVPMLLPPLMGWRQRRMYRQVLEAHMAKHAATQKFLEEQLNDEVSNSGE